MTTFDYVTFPGVPFVTTKPDGTSIEGNWAKGSSDCMTLTYKKKLGSSDRVLTKDNSCKDAVGLCKAKLGKLKK